MGALRETARYRQQNPMIRPEWVLKNDGDKTILYLLSNYQASHFMFPLPSGVVLSLFDGSRSIGDICELVEFLFASSLRSAREYVFHLIDELNDVERYPVLAEHPVLCDGCKGNLRTDLDPVDFATVPIPAAKQSYYRLNAPISLLIFFTNLCQTDCRYCYAERRPIPKVDLLTLAEWRGILEQARSLGVKKVGLSGGDTLARRDAIGFLEILLEQDMLFLVSTKCRVTEEGASKLATAGFCKTVNGVPRDFQFSLDSGDPRIAAFLTRRPGFYARAKKTIENLVHVGISPRVKAVITPYNTSALDMLVEDMVSIGVRRLDFTCYEPSFYRHSQDLELSSKDKKSVGEALALLSSRYPGVRFEGNAFSGYERGPQSQSREAQWKGRAACSGGRTELGITADGKAVICEQTPQEEPFVFGNLRTSSIMDIWRSETLSDFIFPAREKFKDTVCYDCEEFVRCQYELGNCFREAYFATGNPFDAPPNCPHRAPIPRLGDWRNRAVRSLRTAMPQDHKGD